MSKPGYQHLLTYRQLEEIYDLTYQFCAEFLPGRENLRIREQMIHAARSAKQCLVEGYEQESLKSYIKPQLPFIPLNPFIPLTTC